MKRPEIKISIPEVLKVQLVDDWEAITKNQQVIHHTVSFVQIETDMTYPPARSDSSNTLRRPGPQPVPRLRCGILPGTNQVTPSSPPRIAKTDLRLHDRLTEEVVAGLRLYFNKCLGNNLLYRFERGQYSDHYKTLKEDQEVSSIYGAEHLLRLFGSSRFFPVFIVLRLTARMIVNLPEMIAHTAMDPETIAVLKENMSDVLRSVSLRLTLRSLAEQSIETTDGWERTVRICSASRIRIPLRRTRISIELERSLASRGEEFGRPGYGGEGTWEVVCGIVAVFLTIIYYHLFAPCTLRQRNLGIPQPVQLDIIKMLGEISDLSIFSFFDREIRLGHYPLVCQTDERIE